MSDTAPMGRTGPSDLARGFAALVVIATGIVVVATHDDTPVAKAATTIVEFKDADVVSPSGATHAAAFNQLLAAGDVITTGPHGFARLATRNRLVLLGSNAALAVLSGDHQQLRTGTAVVDALDGPGLALDVAGDSLAIPAGSATEAARGVSVRIGALSGSARISSSNGRNLMLPQLHQAVVTGDALPAAPTPLHLMDSSDEDRVVPKLVADDLALKTLARGIDTTGRSTAHVIEASWSGLAQPVVNRTSRSERVLPVLIADATHGGDAQQRYDNAVAWRAQGGSWGVVLHLLNGRASAVESTLASLQKTTQKPGQIGTIVSAVIGSGTSASGSHHVVKPQTGGVGPTRPSTGPTSSGTPSGGGSSTPAPPNLLGSLVSTLQSVIDGVLGLLPHDPGTAVTPAKTNNPRSATSGLTTTKSAHRAQTDATAKPTNTEKAKPSAPSSNGLLGNLLGNLLGHH